MKRRLLGFLTVLISVGGIALLAYPFLGYWYNELHQGQVIQEYENYAATVDKDRWEEERQNARTYNEGLIGRVELTDPFDVKGRGTSELYYSILNVKENGMMGSIRIPEINVRQPIYHGTDNEVLDKGVGHLENTSLPIGGAGIHAVLSAHTGSPAADFFTDLEKLELGAEFYIAIMDDVMAYKVNQIKVVEPKDTGDLAIEPGKDYITLVTCTPYGINSHRLLVRGERTEYRPELEAAELTGLVVNRRLIMAIVAIIVLFSSFIIFLTIKKKTKKDTA